MLTGRLDKVVVLPSSAPIESEEDEAPEQGDTASSAETNRDNAAAAILTILKGCLANPSSVANRLAEQINKHILQAMSTSCATSAVRSSASAPARSSITSSSSAAVSSPSLLLELLCLLYGVLELCAAESSQLTPILHSMQPLTQHTNKLVQRKAVQTIGPAQHDTHATRTA